MSKHNVPERAADNAKAVGANAEDAKEPIGAAANLRLAGITPEELRALVPEETLAKAAPKGISVETEVWFRGPLPPADILKDYEEIDPGSANRIITDFTHEGKHRRARETRGQTFALAALTLILGAAVSCGYFGETWIGCAIAVTGLTGLFATTRALALWRAGDEN